ncbi:helix-turn-helix domain-containing protein [Ferrimonas balearica]|nr:winged helix-turn-helix domain-containing protein [Ferrimonas balearica]MBY6018974.1 winged helix-turn-helix domain-containing protein [Halomonas denitrificans]MBW3141122.1 winged helix-turn-helix domain-containing protein [Ferrimonas balearica]MBW3165676.1 winged helix-turn-helix domain-containing protein [Ferrimonas balearica]MBY5981586.1 winged helix-turn-helix domain-containing protein [Ferrimonas balearica]MBY6095576.1 winged helix-turn-helix domain-containing protein [Ferrimonas balea
MLNPTFCRRVLLLLAIEELDRPSVPALIRHLGWPRRTIQDILKALPGLGVQVQFVEDGIRHNDGYYAIQSWGGLNSEWAHNHKAELRAALD